MATLIIIIWIIDILNIGENIFGFNLRYFLDVTIPINTLGWWLVWIFYPSKN